MLIIFALVAGAALYLVGIGLLLIASSISPTSGLAARIWCGVCFLISLVFLAAGVFVGLCWLVFRDLNQILSSTGGQPEFSLFPAFLGGLLFLTPVFIAVRNVRSKFRL